MHFFFSVAHCVLNTSLKTCMFAFNILMWNLKKQTNIIITMIIVNNNNKRKQSKNGRDGVVTLEPFIRLFSSPGMKRMFPLVSPVSD